MNLYDKANRVTRIKYLLDEFVENEVEPLVIDILRAMGKISEGYNPGELYNIKSYGYDVEVTLRHYSGEIWDHDYTIPAEITRAENSIEAALAWKASKDALDAQEARIKEQQKILQLESELKQLKAKNGIL
jgi:hypothetical protein